jgi:hypothetical protein
LSSIWHESCWHVERLIERTRRLAMTNANSAQYPDETANTGAVSHRPQDELAREAEQSGLEGGPDTGDRTGLEGEPDTLDTSGLAGAPDAVDESGLAGNLGTSDESGLLGDSEPGDESGLLGGKTM